MTMEEVNDNILDLSRRTSASSASPRPISPASSDFSHHKDGRQSSYSSIASYDKAQVSPRSTPSSDASIYGQMNIDTKAFQSSIPQLSSMVPQMSTAVFPGNFDPLALAGTAAGVNPMNPLSLNVNSSDMSSVSNMSAAPWGFYLNHLTGRKRKVPAQKEGSTSPKQSRNEEQKDDAYWDRRRKNNEAAKRSRDARRQKEEEIALRAAFLEQENLKLRAQVTILKNESAKLHFLLYNRSNTQVVTSPSS